MWVALFSLAMAGLAYLPHWLWHSWEGGRMRQMLANIMETPRFFHDDRNISSRPSFWRSQSQDHENIVTSSGQRKIKVLNKTLLIFREQVDWRAGQELPGLCW